MSTIHLHDSRTTSEIDNRNPLPQLLRLPSGLALLEIQGTINLPTQTEQDNDAPAEGETSIGRLVFPDYDSQDKTSTAWMKRVYMYVGKHQRLTGEVKKLPKAIAIIRKKTDPGFHHRMEGIRGGGSDHFEDLEIVEIIKHKIIFSSRPEPVGVFEGEN